MNYTRLRILELDGTEAFDTGGDELIVLPLAGLVQRRRSTASVRARRPRERVQRGHRLRLRAARRARGGDRRRPLRASRRAARSGDSRPRYGAAEDVPVELRGAGNASRQVNNFASVEAFECDALIAVEVLTPERQLVLVSAAPPRRPRGDLLLRDLRRRLRLPARLRRDRRARRRSAPATGSTCRAAITARRWPPPGYDIYYLNVMAGTVREWNFVDDPDHAWIRGTWADQEIDPRLPMTSREEARMRLTVAQALVRFLSVQYSERDGVEQRLIAGLLRDLRARQRRRRRPGAARAAGRDALLPRAQRAGDGAHRGRATRARRTGSRRSACTSSIGPGATNMVTGAALATINRLPVLLLPGDVFATRAPGTVLQELEDPTSLQRLRQRHAAAGLASSGTGSSGPSS